MGDQEGAEVTQAPKEDPWQGKILAFLPSGMQMRCAWTIPADELTERVRLRGLTRFPGGWQGQDPLLWMVISVGYSSHLPLVTS